MYCYYFFYFKRLVEWVYVCISRFRLCFFIINNKLEIVNFEYDVIIYFVYVDVKFREDRKFN